MLTPVTVEEAHLNGLGNMGRSDRIVATQIRDGASDS